MTLRGKDAQKPPSRPANVAGGASVGVHGFLILEAIFRVGCVTAETLARMTGLHKRVASGQLLMLMRAGYMTRERVWPRWSPSTSSAPWSYYLSRKGMVRGGMEAGIEDSEDARKLYGRCEVPARISHASLRNHFFSALSAACREHEGWGFEEPWAENCPRFPYHTDESPLEIRMREESL